MRSPLVAALALPLLLAGCALSPPPAREELVAAELPHTVVPPAFKAGGAAGAVQDRWLASFDDPQLLLLADEALAHNLDLRVAAARVEQAAVSVRLADGNLYPSVDLAARSQGNATGSSGQLSGLVISATWEIDVWGRLRYGARSAESQYASAEADYRAARQSIVATLAQAWFLATEAVQQKALLDEMVAAAERLVTLAEQRQGVGVGTEVDVTLARANAQTLRDRQRQVELAIAQSRRALEMLLGRYPATEIALAGTFAALPPPAITGVPSELLERRPDVIAAERRVAAAFDRVGEAQAARLPRISLSAAVSWLSSSIFVLQERDDPTAGFGATLLYSIFNAGQLQAQVELRTAEQKQAAAQWAQTAQRAFNEVEGVLQSEAALAQRAQILERAAAEQSRALALQETRYRVGSGDLRAVVQQQMALTDARLALLRVQSEQRVQRVALHLALGGDVVPPAEAQAAAPPQR
jgi:NodT family efflux transporter outer membrane factor (OMF) lipoprotein